jgi:hypothetical protein
MNFCLFCGPLSYEKNEIEINVTEFFIDLFDERLFTIIICPVSTISHNEEKREDPELCVPLLIVLRVLSAEFLCTSFCAIFRPPYSEWDKVEDDVNFIICWWAKTECKRSRNWIWSFPGIFRILWNKIIFRDDFMSSAASASAIFQDGSRCFPRFKSTTRVMIPCSFRMPHNT